MSYVVAHHARIDHQTWASQDGVGIKIEYLQDLTTKIYDFATLLKILEPYRM